MYRSFFVNTSWNHFTIILLIISVLASPRPVLAHHAPDGEVIPITTPSTQSLIRLQEQQQNVRSIQIPFSTISSFLAADLGTDGVQELLVSSGPGEQAMIAILRQDGSLITSFHPFPTTNLNGLSVTVGNVQGDALPEIIIGHWAGEQSTVAIFTNTGAPISSFSAFNPSFLGGTNLATIRLSGQTHDLIVVGAGVSGGPHVRVFDSAGNLHSQFFAEAANNTGGVNVASMLSVTSPLLLTAPFSAGDPIVRSWVWDEQSGWTQQSTLRAYTNYPHGVALMVAERASVFSTLPMHGHGGSHLKTWGASSGTHVLTNESFISGNTNDSRTLCTPTQQTIFCFLTAPILTLPYTKHIFVNKTHAMLTAYEYGFAFRRFLVSVGLGNFTPTGSFAVQKKKHWHDYVRFYGLGDRRNYSFKNVEFNLQFKPSYYIHYAYWHKNWGHKMSHGCVNAPYEGVKWLYDWSEIGVPVFLQD